MALALNTFVDIFGANFGKDNQMPLKLEKIVIPKIQRDYAQGRTNSEISRVRSKFLDALYKAVTEKPITLDFIYGDIDSKGVMTPLDGQQRLTTLFLLHWYACKKYKAANPSSQDDFSFLEKFSYETRYSARDFCKYLIKFEPSFNEILSKDIINQSWFPLSWKNDPTINAMLVMLDDIDDKFKGVTDLWQKLQNKAVSFYFLPIKELSLTDELYIKMNSRGKPLTMFEHFKAELEHELRKIDIKIAEEIIKKIDIDWTDMLWDCSNKDGAIDTAFLHYFRFICDIICYKQGYTPQAYKNFNDPFSLLARYFSVDNGKVHDNIEFLQKSFNCWCTVKSSYNVESIDEFFSDRVTTLEHEKGKILTNNKNYFEDCLKRYTSYEGKRTFDLRNIIMLYAFVVYLMNDSIDDSAFRRRIRIINNLVNNSQFEISDTVDRNRMPEIINQVESIIIDGIILDEGFNKYQREEEKLKMTWVEQNPTLAEALYELEDHHLLYGQVDIVGLENSNLFKNFIALFENFDYDDIDCALMALGNYIQCDKNGWRYQSGSTNPIAWRELFHHSASKNFEQTKKCLIELLSKTESPKDIAKDYLKSCENQKLFDWRYYYIKYSEFRPEKFGKYHWADFKNKPYEIIVLQTKERLAWSSYQPFLKAVENGKLEISKEDLGTLLKFGNRYIACENDAYVIRADDKKTMLKRINIVQNAQGIDIEDRIQTFLSLNLNSL